MPLQLSKEMQGAVALLRFFRQYGGPLFVRRPRSVARFFYSTTPQDPVSFSGNDTPELFMGLYLNILGTDLYFPQNRWFDYIHIQAFFGTSANQNATFSTPLLCKQGYYMVDIGERLAIYPHHFMNVTANSDGVTPVTLPYYNYLISNMQVSGVVPKYIMVKALQVFLVEQIVVKPALLFSNWEMLKGLKRADVLEVTKTMDKGRQARILDTFTFLHHNPLGRLWMLVVRLFQKTKSG